MTAILWKSDSTIQAPLDLLEQIRLRLGDRVAAAYYFGSYGTGHFRPDSDLDLILVMETALPFSRRAALFDDLYDLYPRLDILVYTPEEWSDCQKETSGFWKSVRQTLRSL